MWILSEDLAFLTYQYRVDTIDVFSENKRKRKEKLG